MPSEYQIIHSMGGIIAPITIVRTKRGTLLVAIDKAWTTVATTPRQIAKQKADTTLVIVKAVQNGNLFALFIVVRAFPSSVPPQHFAMILQYLLNPPLSPRGER